MAVANQEEDTRIPARSIHRGRGLENAIIATARMYGWRVMHSRPARTAKGWRTALQGMPGFPDFVLVRQIEGHVARLLFIEAKAGRGRLSAAQRAWRDAVVACPGVEYYIVTDEMLDDDGNGCALTRLLR